MAPANAPSTSAFGQEGQNRLGDPAQTQWLHLLFGFPLKRDFPQLLLSPPLPGAQQAPEQRRWRTPQQLPRLLRGSCSPSRSPFLLASPTVSNSEGKAWFVCPVTRRKGLQLGNNEARAGDCCVQRARVGKERTGHLLLPAERGESEGRGRNKRHPSD